MKLWQRLDGHSSQNICSASFDEVPNLPEGASAVSGRANQLTHTRLPLHDLFIPGLYHQLLRVALVAGADAVDLVCFRKRAWIQLKPNGTITWTDFHHVTFDVRSSLSCQPVQRPEAQKHLLLAILKPTASSSNPPNQLTWAL
jgi:hypothetical protein